MLRAIEEYFDTSGRDRKEEAPLFVAAQHDRGEIPLSTNTIAQIVKRRAKQASIARRITPHSLSYTAITLALDGEALVRQVQQLAGQPIRRPPCDTSALETIWMITAVTI